MVQLENAGYLAIGEHKVLLQDPTIVGGRTNESKEIYTQIHLNIYTFKHNSVHTVLL